MNAAAPASDHRSGTTKINLVFLQHKEFLYTGYFML